ncbi:MAG: hypothetical protein IPM55_21735 [Acidobacteria bacterium]|nr:hypothetical protein [Acidobacteriota bacterium]
MFIEWNQPCRVFALIFFKWLRKARLGCAPVGNSVSVRLIAVLELRLVTVQFDRRIAFGSKLPGTSRRNLGLRRTPEPPRGSRARWACVRAMSSGATCFRLTGREALQEGSAAIFETVEDRLVK